MNMLARKMVISATLLAVFAVFGSGLVALTYTATAEQIAQNERQALLENLHALIPPEAHTNDLFADHIQVTDPQWLGTTRPVDVYRARLGEKPVGLVLTPVAPDGYNGDIQLLVAIRQDGVLAGVRVLRHNETPGLGDRIEADRSNWILGFANRSLQAPAPQFWKVKKDGGVFDQFTGATITPRAVVRAVYKTLRYFEENRETLFEQEASAEATAK